MCSSDLPPRKPRGKANRSPPEAQSLPLPTLCVSGPDSSQPGFGPDHLEVSPPQSCLNQEREFPSQGMSRASPPLGRLTRALRTQTPGSSLPSLPALFTEPRRGRLAPPRSLSRRAAAGFPDAQGARPPGLGQPLVERAARRLSSRRGCAVAQLLDREQRGGTPGRCEISAARSRRGRPGGRLTSRRTPRPPADRARTRAPAPGGNPWWAARRKSTRLNSSH